LARSATACAHERISPPRGDPRRHRQALNMRNRRKSGHAANSPN
jgi:hypothetical protein